MFTVFQMFQRYITSVPYWCCKTRSGCCNSYVYMFQVYVLNVLFVSDVCCKCFYLDITKIDLNVTYTCMLHAYFSSVSVFYTSVASVSSRCCICLQWF
jgi:hypothetical protein